MSTISPTVTKRRGWVKVTWPSVTAADTFAAYQFDAWAADRSVAITGTPNGATVVIKGSNDGTNYFELTDPQGNDISKSAADLEQITELTQYIQPTHSGGGGSESMTVTIFAKREPKR